MIISRRYSTACARTSAPGVCLRTVKTLMTIETALKWSRLWWLLSLDLTVYFREELWLKELSQSSLNYIRSTLNLQADLPTYGSDPRPKVYDRLRGFEERFTREALDHLLWWERCVFIHNGGDRASEFIWEIASHSLPSLPSSPSIVSTLQSVQDECSTGDRRTDEKMRSLELSAWDRAAIYAEGSSRDEVVDSIKAIVGANTFARTWHFHITTHGSTFLGELFAAISRVPASPELQFDPETIPFPSSWEFDLQFQGDGLGGSPT